MFFLKESLSLVHLRGDLDRRNIETGIWGRMLKVRSLADDVLPESGELEVSVSVSIVSGVEPHAEVSRSRRWMS
jgi:hypothetical protein